MKKTTATVIAIIILLVSTAMPVFAAENTGQTPSGIPYSSLQAELNKYIGERKDTTSSVSATVFDRTNDLAGVIYGDANVKDSIKADSDTVYEWGSTSKMLIWTSVMQLWEQGKLELDTDIRAYLPQGFLENTSYEKPITLLNLMNHTAGWQETTWDVEVSDKKDIVSLKEALHNTAPPQIYEPGTVSSYSNWGAALAAYIVECVSGMDYADYIHKYIFEPLGMKQTFIRPDGSDNEWAENQREKTNAYLNVQGAYEDYGECRRYILLYPAGSATGTMSDLVRFAKAFLADSESCPIFTKKDTLEVMLSPTLYYDKTDVARICHGLFSLEYGTSLIGHAGNTTGFSSNLMLDTKSKTGIVIMTNEVGETTYNYGLLSLVFGDCKGESGFLHDNLSGIYCNTRANYKKSFLKIYGVIGGLLPLSPSEDDCSYNAMLMGGKVSQISQNVCIMDDGNGTKTYLSIQRDDSGNVTALQGMGGMTFERANTVLFVGQISLLLLWLLSSILALVMLVVHVVRLRKFKQTSLFEKKLLQLLSELFVVISTGMIFWLVIFSDSFTKDQAIWKCVLIIICSFAEGATLITGWPSVKKLDADKALLRNKKQLFSFIVTILCGIISIANVLYWQFYQCFSC